MSIDFNEMKNRKLTMEDSIASVKATKDKMLRNGWSEEDANEVCKYFVLMHLELHMLDW